VKSWPVRHCQHRWVRRLVQVS